MRNDPTIRWSISDALDTYGVEHWGKGYFGINQAGNLIVRPEKRPDRAIDLKRLVDELVERGIHPPVLIRFSDLLRHRIGEVAAAFRTAIEENKYRGSYRCVFPVKVNQQRHVVEEVRDFGAEHGFGFEAGSKPELLAVLALSDDPDAPVICNGFKDDEYIEMVVLAQKAGRRVIPVVEKMGELGLVLRYADRHGIRPRLGVRVKLAARGAGRWELSGGMRSKFGLFVPEVLDAFEALRERGMAECLQLLHFHLGSQITNIRSLKNAINELARVYAELAGMGAGLEYIDIGGGLGVDYDGSQTNFESSMNYTLEEYASDAVYRIMSVCDDVEIPHPTIITESGRAVVAYHAALVFDVLGVSRFDRYEAPEELPVDPEEEETPQPLADLFERLRDLNRRNSIEYYHDGLQAWDEAQNLFNLGYLDLEQRALAEKMFWALCIEVLRHTRDRKYVPEELKGLPSYLSDTYFCNFSLFQSMPDSWAVEQIFPVMPIHRLNERPTRRGILTDITCDSDGKIDRFNHLREDKDTLELHPLGDEPYYVGAFLIGAYQEILGDLHNLFGDTHAVHVRIGEDGEPEIEHLVRGDTVTEVLGYVQYRAGELTERMRHGLEAAVREERLTRTEAAQFLRRFRDGLSGYTYLGGQA